MVPTDDDLPVSEVGLWTIEKHERLRRYVDITRAVRRKFVNRAGATYIDLFSGPGRSIIRETSELVDGSPIVATTKAVEGSAPFTRVFIGDLEQGIVDAARQRLATRGIASQAYVGAAESTVRQIAPELDPAALHFAFLDPFALDPLSFDVIENLAKLQRMDMLIHVSAQDLQRNLRRYMKEQGGPLDRVAPGWRAVVDPRSGDKAIRMGFLNHWLGLIRRLSMAPSQGIELVSGGRNQPLYWLVLISRHPKAAELWEKIRNTSSQGRLGV